MAPQKQQPRLHNEVYSFISPENFSKSLGSQVVVITGAAGVIGSSISKCFAIAGAIVYLMDYNTEPLAELEKTCLHLGAKATFSGRIDVASYEICKDVVERVNKDCGAIDVLVNGAGVGRLGVFHKQDIKWFSRGMSINFIRPLFLMHIVLPDFIARRQGCIINIASRHGTTEVDMYQADDVHMYALHPGGIKSTVSTSSAIHPSIAEELPQAIEGIKEFQKKLKVAPSLPGMVSVALATGIGKEILRGRHLDCDQDLEDIIRRGDVLKSDPQLNSLNVSFLGGLPNDGGTENLPLEKPFAMPDGF